MTNLLAAAHAPAVWQNEVAHHVAPLKDLRRSSDWCLAFCVTWPRLCREPLLGDALTQMAQSTAAMMQSRTGANRSRRGMTRSSSPAQQREGSGSNPLLRNVTVSPPAAPPDKPQSSPIRSRADEPPTHRQLSEVTSLPRRADATLLSYLERELSRSTPSVSASKTKEQGAPVASRAVSRLLPVDLSRIAARLDSLTGQAGTSSNDLVQRSIGLSRESAAQDMWLTRLIKRAYPILDPRNQVQVKPSESDEMALAAQWSAFVGGPTAPPELLSRLVTMTRRDATTNAIHQPGQSARISPATRDRAALPNSSSEELQQQSGLEADSQSSLTFSQLARSVLPALGATHDGAAPVQSSWQTSASADVEAGRIAPPMLGPMLPPLVASMAQNALTQGAPIQGTPTQPVPIQPIASTMARHGALLEAGEAETEAELDVLAAKIKRILDEEARRHGIDV